MSDLPTPPVDDHKPPQVRKSSSSSSSTSTSSSSHKHAKGAARNAKRSNSSNEHGLSMVDGRHKRVWKACERCRMKKTKCDGESPCKRCKDDGLVCTAGSRRKTEFKQLPRGYAEVLENTQYALIATVQKLYTMVRNHESWELGDPDINDRGLPVIHDIASRLGCIRPSPDLPFSFPEGAEDFAELQAQLEAAQPELADEMDSQPVSHASVHSPTLHRNERASSSETDHSALSKDYDETWSMNQQSSTAASMHTNQESIGHRPMPPPLSLDRAFAEDMGYSSHGPLDARRSLASPAYTDFSPDSPMFKLVSPFAPWSAGDDFLSPPHLLGGTAQYLRQPYPTTPCSMSGAVEPSLMKDLAFQNINFAETATIRPNMLDCNTGYDLQMDSIMYNVDFDSQMGIA